MDLKESLKFLMDNAVKAAGPQLVEKDPTKSYASVDKDGAPVLFRCEPANRNHVAKDLETVVAFAERFRDPEDDRPSVIWYSRDKIVCLIDDATRRDRVSVNMICTVQIAKLAFLEGSKPHVTQHDLLFMLRTVFTPDALTQAPKLIDVLRKVKFVAASSADSDIQRGRSSVGKSLEQAATFVETLPETVMLTVPVFANSFCPQVYDVVCALEVLEGEQRFQLFPLPGEIEKAYARAEANLCQSLMSLLGTESTIPVYYGEP